jgi:ferredoxin
MKIELKYFSGTGNSWKILDTCKNVFAENRHIVSIAPIEINEQLPSDADIIGFCFPVYAFGIPRVCRRYLKQLQQFSKPQNGFVIITAGKQDESGFSVNECVKILRKKNVQIIYTAVVEMPANWTTYLNPPPKEEALAIIEKGIKQATEIGNDILNGTHRYHRFNIPQNYRRFGLYREYYLFKHLGLQQMWRSFKVYGSCNGCGVCEKLCPTGSVKLVMDQPVWSSSCEQCMRCVNFCPEKAIYQSMGGGTNGRNRYHVHDFKPLNK